MTDTILRHTVAFVATLIAALTFFAGYFAGQYGWWWTAFSMLIIYGMIYKVVDAGGHGGGKH